ncbi:MAG: cytosolic protein [Planctomycetes bacterium]|nr:cytosolic protein [Planctomycetota bacterium]
MGEFDSPWKEALEQFLPQFLAFFFPRVFAGVDWERGYQSLETELQQIVREAELGVRLADKLFKVWRRDGEETWVLVHAEVQNQPEQEFGERIYVYNYRIFDRFRRPVVSLAVLGDSQRDWRPDHFGYDLWGFSVRMEFPIAKVVDYADQETELERDANPFAAIVLAHLKTLATRDQPDLRRFWKVRVVKSLFERGLDAEQVRQFFRVIDWLMELPAEAEQQFRAEILRYEQEKQMPYLTSLERMAEAKGREEGREEGRREGLLRGIEVALEIRFGSDGRDLLPLVQAEKRTEVLEAVQQALLTAKTPDEIRTLLEQP